MIRQDNRVADIRMKLRYDLLNKNFAGDGNLEIINASFIADESTIFGTVDEDYVVREAKWYCNQSRNIKDFPGGAPKIWQSVADRHGYVNSNYGWCVHSEENHEQFVNAVKSLQDNQFSRQAVMIYTRPSMHYDAVDMGRKDFMCTNNTQMFIRDKVLHYIVNMRSNDVVFGYKNDYAWQERVWMLALAALRQTYPGIERGNMYWNAGSLHVYPRHFHLLTDGE